MTHSSTTAGLAVCEVGEQSCRVAATVDSGLAADDSAGLLSLLDTIHSQYGYDFRGYARSSLRRRLAQGAAQLGFSDMAGLERRISADPALFARLLDLLTVQVSEMFRDPEVYARLRDQVVPHLRTYPTLKVWIAGCASGQEAHSMAILLHEEGLLARTIVYATDLSASVLERARLGIYPAERLRAYADSYRRAGGRSSLVEYFTVAHGLASISPLLTSRIHFAGHNLIADEVFGEMNLVLCRNVLIYFGRELQERVLDLLTRSLVAGGFLCLGAHENLRLSSHADAFTALAPGSKIFCKKVNLPSRSERA